MITKHLTYLFLGLAAAAALMAQPAAADIAPDCNGLSFDGRQTSSANEPQVQVPGCMDRIDRDEYDLPYVGHDEPSVVFYSEKPHSASNLRWEFVLPTENAPPAIQSFQNFTAFWFGLPLCDANSVPFQPCTPASDTNDPNTAGSAVLELQFYPPGKDRNSDAFSCSIDQWCAAVAIFSFNESGTEPFNFAWIQTDGVPTGHPGPSSHPLEAFTPNAKTLLMGQGDRIRVTLKDTPIGLVSVVEDLTTGASGFMVASAANGFETVDGSGRATPFDFRPEYDTAMPEHIVPGAFARVGVMFAFEIGHNEQADNDSDDGLCSSGPVVPACYRQDTDYDGTSYAHDWPDGTDAHGTSIHIASAEGGGIGPLSASDRGRDYDGVYGRIQFETTANIGNPACLANPALCVVQVPFDGMAFYPFYAFNEQDIGHRRSLVGARASGEKMEGVEEVCYLLFGDFANSRETNNFGGDAQYGLPDARNRLELVSDVEPNPCIPITERRHSRH
jgi:hypothetical protein